MPHLTQIDGLISGNSSNQTINGILDKLAVLTQPEEGPVHDRDLKTAVTILNKTLEYNSNQKNTAAVDKNNRQNFINVASNLLNPLNIGAWQHLRKVLKITGS